MSTRLRLVKIGGGSHCLVIRFNADGTADVIPQTSNPEGLAHAIRKFVAYSIENPSQIPIMAGAAKGQERR